MMKTPAASSEVSTSLPAAALSEAGALFREDTGGSEHEAGHRESTIPCRFFLKGYCSAGAACRFSHVIGSTEVRDAIMPAISCHFHARGYCKAGELCKFSHDEHVEPPRDVKSDANVEVPVCLFFQSLRGCKNANCHFKHINPVHPTVSTSPAKIEEASKILDKYSAVKKAEIRGSDVEIRRPSPV